ncbi:glycosyltransferase family 9 protein [Streptomyces mobaraensis]|uniref:glycosyltransferase family 9 protein n=1 Tax=Streptomyces mobaraensis TaxID=35621 RepID=UPI0033D15191
MTTPMTTPTTTRTTTRTAVFAHLRAPGLGDLLQRNIGLALVRRARPATAVTLIVGEDLAARFGPVLTRHTYATDVLPCPQRGEADPRWPAFLRTLADRRFALAVVDPDSQGLHAGHARAAGVPERIGLPQDRPGDEHITHPIRLPRPLWGTPDLYEYATALAAALGLSPPPRPGDVLPELPRTRDVRPPTAGLPRPLVAVHPGGAPHWNRRWPHEHYARLCARLAAELSASLCLLGDAAERPELELLRHAVLTRYPRAVVHIEAGADLDRAANVLADADLLVGNDSSLAHVAAAVRTPSVVLYGPTGTEYLWTRIYPYHRGVSLRWPCQRLRHAAGELAGRRCAHGCVLPYQGPAGPYPRCLADLPVDRVWPAVTARWASPHPVTIRSTP